METDTNTIPKEARKTLMNRVTSTVRNWSDTVRSGQEDKFEPEELRAIFLDANGKFVRLPNRAVTALPEPLQPVYVKLLSSHNKIMNEAKASKDVLSAPTEKREDLVSEIEDAKMGAYSEKLFEKIMKKGAKASVTLSKDQEDYLTEVRKRAASVVAESMSVSSSTQEEEKSNSGAVQDQEEDEEEQEDEREEPESEEITKGSVGGIVDLRSLNSMDLSAMIIGLAEGLEYDRFDAVLLRAALFSKKVAPTLQELVCMCETYIYVGNNATRLGSKVKKIETGKVAAAVLNKFGVKARKLNSKTITLARIGIAFSPIVWALRCQLSRLKKLPTAGVVTTTPHLMQDVALSGVSDKLPDGAQMNDFLIKFNRVLMKVAEKDSKAKSTEEQMDATASKFHEISLTGAKSDFLVQEWNFKVSDGVSEMQKFYEDAKKAGTVSQGQGKAF